MRLLSYVVQVPPVSLFSLLHGLHLIMCAQPWVRHKSYDTIVQLPWVNRNIVHAYLISMYIRGKTLVGDEGKTLNMRTYFTQKNWTRRSIRSRRKYGRRRNLHLLPIYYIYTRRIVITCVTCIGHSYTLSDFFWGNHHEGRSKSKKKINKIK